MESLPDQEHEREPGSTDEPDDQETSEASGSTGPETESEPSAKAASKPHIPDIPVTKPQSVHCQEDLDRILTAHQKWVDEVLDPDIPVAMGRANLKGADLRGLSLRGVNLSGASLGKANLAECDLTQANLTAADLRGAILACANLGGARLRGARLDGADLRGADLTGAHLAGVDLSKALLRSPEEIPSPAETEPATLTAEVSSEAAPVPMPEIHEKTEDVPPIETPVLEVGGVLL